MTVREQTDVLVVGAGPAGSATAAWLARLGRRRAADRRGRLPPRQDLRRRPDAPRDRRARAARSRRLAARPHGQPGPARPRLRPDAAAAVAGRHPARLGFRGRPHRARRPPPHHRDQVRRPGASTACVRSTYDATASGSAPWCSVAATRPSRSTAGGSIVADGVRSPLGKVLGPGVAPRHRVRRRRALLRHLDDVRRPVDQLPPRAPRRAATRCCPATAGSSRSGTGEVNLGVGTLATSKRPADLQVRRLMTSYADTAARGVRARRRAPRPDQRPAADGRRGQRRGRRQLGARR